MVIWDTKMCATWQLYLLDNKSPAQDNLLSFLVHEKPTFHMTSSLFQFPRAAHLEKIWADLVDGLCGQGLGRPAGKGLLHMP